MNEELKSKLIDELRRDEGFADQIRQIINDNNEFSQDPNLEDKQAGQEVSRRDFLKKTMAGLGVAGIGAAGLISSGSALSFRSDNPIDLNKGLSVASDGKTSIGSFSYTDEESKPILVGSALESKHEYRGYDDLITAIDEAPKQSEIVIQGNIVVDRPLAPTGTYINLRGRGGYNRGDEYGMPSIIASENFEGDYLVDLSKMGNEGASKWGSIKNLNLFCAENVANGIRTGRSDNGKFQNLLLRGPTEIGLKVEGGAFDNVVDRCIIKGVGNSMDVGIQMGHVDGGSGSGGNEPKVYKSLIRDYTTAGIRIAGIGRVGPRIIDTSFRGAGGLYGIEILDNDRTGNCSFLRCQFEGHNQSGSACIKAESNGGSTVDWWAAGCHFNKNNARAIETTGKVGHYIVGPFNQIGCPVELNGTSASSGDSVLMFNAWNGDLLENNRNPAAPLTIMEPGKQIFDFGATESLKIGRTSQANITADSSNNLITEDSSHSKSTHKARKFDAEGSTGGRSFRGAYDNHPSANKGDVWYITGNGSPEEGFYGQTENGATKLG